MELAIRGSNLLSGYPVAALDETAIGPRVDKTASGPAFAKNSLARPLINSSCGIIAKMQFVAEMWRSGHPVASALIKRPLGLALIKRPLGLLLLRIAWPGR